MSEKKQVLTQFIVGVHGWAVLFSWALWREHPEFLDCLQNGLESNISLDLLSLLLRIGRENGLVR